MPNAERSLVSSLLSVVTALLLAGCAVFNISQPSANSTVASPVTVSINWGESLQPNTLKIVLDPSGANTDVTNQFTVNTPPTGNATATGTLAISPGSHTLSVGGNLFTWYYQAYESTSTTVNFTVPQPAFNVGASPNPLAVPVNGHATLTVNVTAGSGINGPVNLTLGPLPSHVTAPAIPNIPGAGGSTSTVISATSSASPGHSTVTLTGSAASGQSATSNFTLNIGSAPTISSVSPSTQSRAGSVTISGANFDTTCANDKVTIGGVAATPTAPCLAASLKVTVPAGASFEPNPGQLTVATGAGTSNAVSFVVARQAGAFTEITNSIEGKVSGQTCTGGTVQVQVCSSNCGSSSPYVATYKKVSGGAQIGQQIPFYENNSTVSGLGGAGFSLCTIGVVLDGNTNATGASAQLMGIIFLDLTSGNPLPEYYFNYYAPAGGNPSYVPRIFDSPDGTILILASAATTGPYLLTAAVFDQANPHNGVQTCQSLAISSAFSASITSSNQVSVSLAGTACTIAIH